MSDETGRVGCSLCGREWPVVTFRETARAIASGHAPGGNVICDQCKSSVEHHNRFSREGQIAEKVDEAQGVRPAALSRRVIVSGIKSGTNVSSFEYATHYGSTPRILTDLCVVFSVGDNETRYIYHDVPVAVCEAWYAAPSKGGFFIQFIKTSYDSEKVK